MRRRELIGLLMVAGAARPLASLAQASRKVMRIAVLSPFPSSMSPLPAFDAFGKTLRELGWIEDQNVVFENRWAEGRADRLNELADDLAQLNPDVIFSPWGTPASLAAKNATLTIPVVFAGVGDAVGVGVVSSLARPGGNVTGSTFVTEETIAKQLELLKELVPALSRVAILVNPSNPVYRSVLKASEAPPDALHLRLKTLGVERVGDFEGVFEAAAKEGAGALVVLRDPILIIFGAQLVELAARHRLPTIYGMSDFVEAGGLMSYGPNLRDMYRRAAHVVDKILRGTKPSDVPVEQATRFELVINLKTAKALGLTVPQSLLIRADEIIE